MRNIICIVVAFLIGGIAPVYAKMPEALIYSESLDSPHTIHIWVYGKHGMVHLREYHPPYDVPYMREMYPEWVKAIFKDTKGSITGIGVYPLEIILWKKPDSKWDTILPVVFPVLKTAFVLGSSIATQSLDSQ